MLDATLSSFLYIAWLIFILLVLGEALRLINPSVLSTIFSLIFFCMLGISKAFQIASWSSLMLNAVEFSLEMVKSVISLQTAHVMFVHNFIPMVQCHGKIIFDAVQEILDLNEVESATF